MSVASGEYSMEYTFISLNRKSFVVVINMNKCLEKQEVMEFL